MASREQITINHQRRGRDAQANIREHRPARTTEPKPPKSVGVDNAPALTPAMLEAVAASRVLVADSTPELLIDAKCAGLLLSCNPRTVKRMAERGEIPALRIGNRWRFSRKTLANWCEQRLSCTQRNPCPEKGATG